MVTYKAYNRNCYTLECYHEIIVLWYPSIISMEWQDITNREDGLNKILLSNQWDFVF